MPQKSTKSAPRKRGRPAGRPENSDVRNKLLREGLIFLTEKGYTSAGIDEILLSAQVPKGSFYYHFKNKADFGLHLVDAYHLYFMRKLDRCLTNADVPYIQRVQAFMEDAAAGMKRHGFQRGCLIGNLGQEMGGLPEAFRAKLIAVLEDWQSRLATCLASAQADGTLAAHHNPHQLAVNFWIGWEGAVLRAKLERREAPLTSFADFFMEHLRD